MITAVICFAAVLWVPGLVILLVSARRAPVGFEDANGFHAVREQDEQAPVFGASIQAH